MPNFLQGYKLLPNLTPAFLSIFNLLYPSSSHPSPTHYGPATRACFLQTHHSIPLLGCSICQSLHLNALPWISDRSSNVQDSERLFPPKVSSLGPCLAHRPVYLLPCPCHTLKLSYILVYWDKGSMRVGICLSSQAVSSEPGRVSGI